MKPTDWITKPTVQFRPGRVPSALVQLRNAAPAYSVQPNPECLVFFHLGSDHWPVSIEFLQPIPVKLAFKVITYLVSDGQGSPAGISQKQAHACTKMTAEELTAVLGAMDEAQGKLESAYEAAL